MDCVHCSCLQTLQVECACVHRVNAHTGCMPVASCTQSWSMNSDQLWVQQVWACSPSTWEATKSGFLIFCTHKGTLIAIYKVAKFHFFTIQHCLRHVESRNKGREQVADWLVSIRDTPWKLLRQFCMPLLLFVWGEAACKAPNNPPRIAKQAMRITLSWLNSSVPPMPILHWFGAMEIFSPTMQCNGKKP